MAKANYRAMETNMCKYICDDIVCVYFVSRMPVFLFSQFWLVWMEKRTKQSTKYCNAERILYLLIFFLNFHLWISGGSSKDVADPSIGIL